MVTLIGHELGDQIFPYGRPMRASHQRSSRSLDCMIWVVASVDRLLCEDDGSDTRHIGLPMESGSVVNEVRSSVSVR